MKWMKELDKGKLKKQKAIANEIKTKFGKNKSTQPKRADAIVKACCNTTTKIVSKKLTDINALCDEYFAVELSWTKN